VDFGFILYAMFRDFCVYQLGCLGLESWFFSLGFFRFLGFGFAFEEYP